MNEPVLWNFEHHSICTEKDCIDLAVRTLVLYHPQKKTMGCSHLCLPHAIHYESAFKKRKDPD